MAENLIKGVDVLRAEMANEEFQTEWKRTALARDVAIRVVAYRHRHGLSHTALGRLLGMAQSGVGRLEAGAHTPTLEILSRLARIMGDHFLVDVGPGGTVDLIDRAS